MAKNIVKKVVDRVEDVVEDGFEYLMKPEVFAIVAFTLLFLFFAMYYMKRDDEIEGFLNQGCHGFIQKPFSLNEFARALRKILDKPTTDC